MHQDIAQNLTNTTRPSEDILIAFAAGGKTDTSLVVKSYTFNQLETRLSSPKVGQKDGSYYIRGGDLVEPSRSDTNLKSADLLIIDGDATFDPETGEITSGAPSMSLVCDALCELEIPHIAHTSHSYKPNELWKYRIVIPFKMHSQQELSDAVDFVIDNLHQKGIWIADVPENKRWSQPWYLPRVNTEADLKHYYWRSSSNDDGISFAKVSEHSFKRRQIEKTESKIKNLPAQLHNSIDAHKQSVIEQFNNDNGKSPEWVRRKLEAAGYRFSHIDKRSQCIRMISPTSETQTAGVVIFQGSRGHWCAYSHHGTHDPLSGKVTDPFALYAMLDFNGDNSAAVRWIMPKPQTIAEQLQRQVAPPVEQPAPQTFKVPDKPRRIQLIKAQDLTDEPISWLVDTMMPARGLAALYGRPGSYKSFVALYMAGCIASGASCFGKSTIQGEVVYIAGEGGAGLKKRWDALRIKHSLPDNTQVHFVKAQLNLRSTQDDMLELIAVIKEASVAPRLIIVDTLARAFAGGDENSASDMGAFISITGAIQESMNCAMLIVHHSGKDEAKGMRGSSALLGAVDAEMECAKTSSEMSEDRVGQITITKQKDGEDGVSIAYKMELVRVNKHDPNVTSLAVEPIDQVIAKGRVVRLTPQQRGVYEALSRAIDDAGETTHINDKPDHLKAVQVSLWRETHKQMVVLEGDTLRKAFDRGVDALIRNGTCGKWGKYAWITATCD
jgi:hypothetical protein